MKHRRTLTLLRKDARPRADLARDVRALLESVGAMPADGASSEAPR